MLINLYKNSIRVFVVFILLLSMSMPSLALKTTMTFDKLGVQNDIQLRTVKNSFDVNFTRPKNSNFKVDPTAFISFRLSPSLLPERYSLTIFLNGNIIKTVKGSSVKNDADNTISVKLPLNKIQDYNTLTFSVNQHYTYKCEDSFDSSLWTIIKKDSYIDFDYDKKHASADFALYPYPFFDELAYLPTEVSFSVPESKNISDETLNSIALINSNIAKFTAWRNLKVLTSEKNDKYSSKNKIIIGTPLENKEISKYSKYLPYKLSNGLLVNDKNIAYDKEGILMLINNPEDESAVILFVTGNSPEGVYKAAKALIQNPVSHLIKGNKSVINKVSTYNFAEIRDWKDYIHKKETKFQDLGLEDKTTRGVTAAPIEYNFKLMPDLYLEPGSRAKLTVYYNYAAGLDYNLSNLEIILNGISLHSKKLEKPTGDNFKVNKLELEIPVENLQLYNNLKFQYHIYPEQYDACRFVTDEGVWGTIYKKTSLKLPAEIKAKIPDLDYLNDGGYPFTAYPDMQNTLFVMNNSTDYTDIKSLIELSTSFGKQMFFNDYMNFKVIKAGHFNKKDFKDYNIIAFGKFNNFDFYNYIKTNTMMNYSNRSLDMKNAADTKQYEDILSAPNLGIVEQIISPFNANRVIMILFGENNAGLTNASSLFSDKEKFQNIKKGNIAVVAENTVKFIDNYPADKTKFLFTEDIAGKKIMGISISWIYIVLGSLGILWIIKNIFLKK